MIGLTFWLNRVVSTLGCDTIRCDTIRNDNSVLCVVTFRLFFGGGAISWKFPRNFAAVVVPEYIVQERTFPIGRHEAIIAGRLKMWEPRPCLGYLSGERLGE